MFSSVTAEEEMDLYVGMSTEKKSFLSWLTLPLSAYLLAFGGNYGDWIKSQGWQEDSMWGEGADPNP